MTPSFFLLLLVGGFLSVTPAHGNILRNLWNGSPADAAPISSAVGGDQNSQGGILGGVGDIIQTGRDAAAGVVQSVPNLIPDPKQIFESSKNLIAGYPLEVVANAINAICSTAVSANSVASHKEPDIKNMNFQLFTRCKNYSYPLMKASAVWSSPEFSANKKVVIFATGWSNTINESVPLEIMSEAFLCRNDVNFIAVDSSNYLDTLYSWSALNTESIGEAIAVALEELVKTVPLENIHLVGHSLGAHIVGSAARNFYERTGKMIPRITGLDPAKPCFNEGETLSGLQRGDADFIDIIHSNPGVLGKRDSLGDVDFYPGGLSPLPPGCTSISCAHSRSVEYFSESVRPGNEHNFPSRRCRSLTNLHSNKCKGAETPMGYAVDMTVKGNFFLDVQPKSPYGKKARGRTLTECGKC